MAIILGNIYPEKGKEHYGDGEKFGVRIQYVQQDKPKGTETVSGVLIGQRT
jgi:glucose-1-phosphate thymidylyltransferase